MATAYEIARCPACGSSNANEIATAEDVRAEIETLWAFHTRRLRPDTPTAQLEDRIVFSQRPPLRIVRCTRCDTVYRNPREHERTLADIYGAESLTPEVMARLLETQRTAYRVQARRLARIAGRRGRGLEVGSYVGAFLLAAADEGWRFQGIDVNESASTFAREHGLDVAHGTLEQRNDDGASFDAIAVWNCFDQLPRPRESAAAAAKLLNTGGVLALRVPNGAFYARMRPYLDGTIAPLARALLAHNNLLGFPYRNGFTTASLTQLLSHAGLHVVHVHGDTLVPIADHWTRRWAAWEERLVKRALRMFTGIALAPWFEIYARK